MGRSNNQLRRQAKARGRVFIPKTVKSKTRNQQRRLKVMAAQRDPRLSRKLPYHKVRGKGGKITRRKFRAGGYNHSGTLGKATGVKGNARKHRAGACAALRQRHAHVRTATLRSALVTTTVVAVRHAGSSQSLPATAAAAATTMFVREHGDTSLDALSLDAVLQHLQRFQQQQQQPDVTCVQRALERVVQLDVSDDDTRRIAALPLVAADATQAHNNDNNNNSSSSVDATASPLRRHLVLQCMHDYPHAPSLRACCCRCLANMCQLPTASATTTTTDDDSRHAAVSTTSSSTSASLAEQLVQQGAIEAIVGTLRMSARLRAHERRWAAQALANVVCLSHSGAARAAAAGAERAIAEFVLHLLDEHDTATTTTNASASVATAAAAAATTATRRRDDVCTALDAALASLGAVLAAVAPENAQCVSHNYERVHYVAVDAMVRALLWCSAWLVRDGRDDGVCSGVLPPRRPRTHTLQYTTTNNNDNDNDADATRMTSRQRTALLRGLPLLHKTLLALQHVCAHAANMPLVYTALDDVASTTTTTATMTTTTTRTMALQCVLDAIEFVTLHVVVVGENNSDDSDDDDGEAAMLRSLQRDVHAWSLDCIAALSTPRRHHDSSSSSSSADHTREQVTSADDATRATAAHALVSPTRAAHVVTHVLMSGTASRLALSTVVRTRNNNSSNSDKSNTACDDSLRCYREHDYALLTQALTVLTHMACLSAAATTTSSRYNDNDNDNDDAVSSDCVVASRNTVAALETLLIDAHDTLRTLASALHTHYNDNDNNDANDKTAYTALQLQLFVSSEGATSGDTTTTITTTAVQHRRVAVQQLTLTAHVYAVLWALLAQHEAANDSNNSNTVPVVSTRTLDIVRALHAMLCDVYVRAADNAAAAAAAATALRSKTGTRTSMSSSLSSSSLSSQQQREKAVAWVSTRVEEQLRRAVQLGARLLDCAARRDGAAHHQDDDKQ